MPEKNTADQKSTKIAARKVLLAEDDSAMRRFVEVILQKAGFEVFAAEDGLAAMKIAFENEIDAVVADALMPNMSGYDLCRILRSNPDKKHIPLVILSGLDKSDSPEQDCLADAYLVKGNKLKEEITMALKKLLAEKSNS